ncbi:hypothetical protein ACFRJ1_02700 [Streptomyces sp. NPDC056773]|uniref:hypothetical protein n=1 Tax=unclassified Streptomyces TaxID=2593676 RepID=UPI0036914EEE
MADKKLEDDQRLWRSVFTTAGGWSEDAPFADHQSVAAAALAEADGTLVCVHRGARVEGKAQQAVRWTWHRPASVVPYAEKLAALVKKAEADKADAELDKQVAAAAEELAAARRWAPDADLSDLLSTETPAVVNDRGVLRCVYAVRHGGDDGAAAGIASLYEAVLTPHVGGGTLLAPARIITGYEQYSICRGVRAPVAPALAVFRDKVHLVFVDAGGDERRVRHLVREEIKPPADALPGLPGLEGLGLGGGGILSRADEWLELRVNDEPIGPKAGEGNLVSGLGTGVEYRSRYGYPAGIALAVHEDRLHLVFRKDTKDPVLYHATFDGTKWTEGTELGQAFASRRNAAIASFDGALHLVFPPTTGDTLRHAALKDGVWSKPQDIPGHTSRNTPTLQVITDGPEGALRQALLMVHRGIDTYVEPQPPAPTPPPAVSELVRTESVFNTDTGIANWSRVRHGLHASKARFADGTTGVVATWHGRAEYYWGFFGYYGDAGTHSARAKVDGKLRLLKPDGALPEVHEFTGEFDSNGLFQIQASFPKLPSGQYTVVLGAAKKTGGYWWGTGPLSLNLEEQGPYFSNVELYPMRATITL